MQFLTVTPPPLKGDPNLFSTLRAEIGNLESYSVFQCKIDCKLIVYEPAVLEKVGQCSNPPETLALH